jgi:prepilin peptidase CpaA
MIGIMILCAAVTVYVATAACTDVRLHRVPNWVTVPAALLGLAYHATMPAGLGVLASLAGFAVGLALLLVPWLLGGAGMGDVKLLAALGAWLSPKWLLAAFILSMLLASLMALVTMLHSTASRGLWRAGKRFSSRLRPATDNPGAKKPKRVVPFAVPVALGTWAVLVWLVCKGTL